MRKKTLRRRLSNCQAVERRTLEPASRFADSRIRRIEIWNSFPLFPTLPFAIHIHLGVPGGDYIHSLYGIRNSNSPRIEFLLDHILSACIERRTNYSILRQEWRTHL